MHNACESRTSYVWGKEPQTVVGVIEQLARPNDVGGKASAVYAVVLPVNVPYNVGGNYLLRAGPTRRAEVLAAVDAALDKVDPSRIILERQTFTEIRKGFFKQDRAMAFLLLGVSLALLIITALGVVGLASFWVQERTRQIGIRRALGATRSDILRYFQVENFILATLGIVLGMVLAYAIEIRVLALAERVDDILPLARHFLAAGKRLTADAREALRRHAWPGNVRELKNALQRAALLAAGPDIGAADLALPGGPPRSAAAPGPVQPAVPAPAAPPVAAAAAVDDEPDRSTIEAALARAGGVIAQAAAELGLSRQALYRRMEKLSIGRE